MSDVCIISSLRDGLNMVSYEYVASQIQRKGVLVMSQYAGAVKLLPSCVVINPWDIDRFAQTIGKVLEMPADERARRHEENFDVVSKWTR